MIIYKTTNLINGKIYIGKAVRNRPSYLGSGVILKQAIKKYGKENFKKEILEVCSSVEELNDREKYWIAYYNSIKEGYNITEGGTGGDTWTNSKKSVHWNVGRTAWNKGIPMTDEVREKVKKAKIEFLEKNPDKKTNSGSYKSGKDHPFYGKTRDPKIYEKIVAKRRLRNNFIAKGVFAAKKVKNIEDGLIYNSIQEAADFYGLTRNQVGHSCRKQTGKFRFVENVNEKN